MISCGEASGDLYAGALAAEIRRLDPDVEIVGFGGERLRAAGAQLVGDYRGFAVTGLAEAVKVLPRAWRMLRRLARSAAADPPRVFVAVDFPDFNFRLARAVRRLGIPVVYYVSPQLWAWRSGRMATMKALASKVLVIFPFEEALYRQAGVPVEFVGHPLMDLIPPLPPRDVLLGEIGMRPDAPTVALLPGSRANELSAILPTLADAARLIAATVPDVQFVVARAPDLDDRLFLPVESGAWRGGPPVATVEGRTDAVLAAADVVVTASGTATVQTAFHGKPMVIVYRLSALSYHLGRHFVKVDTYGMVNLVAGRRIAPELIQDRFTAQAVAEETIGLLTDEARRAAVREALAEVRARLGGSGASTRAALAVLNMARDHGAASAVLRGDA
jgi:lipid-A-disaccharide synthase